MARHFIVMAGAFGFLGVAAGAFGAHILRNRLSADLVEVFETAVRYQMYHALSLLAVGILAERFPGPLATASGWLFVAGILVFSGSLYVLTLTGIRWLGAVTPLGGTALLAGWVCLVGAVLFSRQSVE
jgi:uncharacterized membrane protein YgdD (TMEM256/DUF423 family)